MIDLNKAKQLLESGFSPLEVIKDMIEERTKLESLCQMMFDPENRPPQKSINEAWKQYLVLVGANKKASKK